MHENEVFKPKTVVFYEIFLQLRGRSQWFEAIFAIFLNETITMGWWLRGHLAHNWTLKQFFMHPMTSFRLFQLYLLWWLMWRTFFG